MPKIKVVSVTYGPADRLVVADDKGRVWVKAQNGLWVQETGLPEEPETVAED